MRIDLWFTLDSVGERVSIRLFGDFAVSIGSRQIDSADFERRTGADLVQLLAASPNKSMHRDQVLDALWPDADIDSAKNRFYKAATYARNALDQPDAIVVRNQVVMLFPESVVSVDIEIVASATSDVDEALGTYRREFLPAAAYDEWVVRMRNQLHQTLLDRLVEAARWDDVLELEPAHERAAVSVMERDLQRGDRQAVLQRFVQLEQYLVDELGVVPSQAAVQLRDRALTDETGFTRRALGGRALAGPTTTTIGREREVEELESEVGRSRLVTVVGPGGAGKTQLARQAALRCADGHNDGARFVGLASVAQAAGAEQELLSAIGGRHDTDTSVAESIVRTLVDADVLLVLDNCEHVLPAIATLVDEIINHCPQVRILATSRLALQVSDESTYLLHRLSPSAARQLFAAEAQRHGVDLKADNPAVARICARLDNLPLAVRLAATRTRSFDLQVVEGMLDHRFEVLQAAGSEPHDQAKTLFEAITWSVEDLTPELASTLSDLAAFAGSFTVTDAIALTSKKGESASLVALRLDDLVARSLVDVSVVAGVHRYRLLESIRLLASQRDESLGAALRHMRYFVERAEAAQDIFDDDSRQGLEWFRGAWSDLRQAKVTAQGQGCHEELVRLVSACGAFALVVLQFELLEWCQEALDPDPADVTSDHHAIALSTWASLARYRGLSPEASRTSERAARDHGHIPEVVYAQAWMAWNNAEATKCSALLRSIVVQDGLRPATEAAALTLLCFAQAGSGLDCSGDAHRLMVLTAGRGPNFEALALLGAFAHQIWSDPVAALDALERCAQIGDAHGLTAASAQVRTARSLVALFNDDKQTALGQMHDALAWTTSRGLWSLALASLGTAALLLDSVDRTDIAVTLLAARVALGYTTAVNPESHQMLLDRAKAEHSESFEAWWESGSSLAHRGVAKLTLATIEEQLRILNR